MANFLALATLITPGDEVLIEHPVYEPLLAAAGFLGARVKRFVRSPDEGFRLDPDAVAQALTPATRLVIITNLHNPSGAYADRSEEHTSELQSLMRIPYSVFCLKKKNTKQ